MKKTGTTKEMSPAQISSQSKGTTNNRRDALVPRVQTGRAEKINTEIEKEKQLSMDAPIPRVHKITMSQDCQQGCARLGVWYNPDSMMTSRGSNKFLSRFRFWHRAKDEYAANTID